MKNLLFIFLFCAALTAHPQSATVTERSCGTAVPDQAWDDWFNARVEEFKSSHAGQKVMTNFSIPVIFHVIHGGQAVGTYPNISPAQINSQVTILNFDYGGFGFNVGKFSNTSFPQSLIANTNINFCLAEKDPQGFVLFERGVDRIDHNSKGWANPTSFTSNGALKTFVDNTIKPNTIWDPERYLNIWVTDVGSGVDLLGYATFPPGSGLSDPLSGLGTATDDGVWCLARVIGDVGTLTTQYDKGRTATHEIGHYLGLRHIWGDNPCGTDYCADTPPQQTSNLSCPSFPKVSCSNGPNGELFMNFMDYSPDACMYMFTNDQRTRMQTAMTNSPLRNQLTASSATVCGAVGIEERRASAVSVDLFPNPSASKFYVTVKQPVFANLEITVYNVLGGAVFHDRIEQPGQQLEIDLTRQADGIYFVELGKGQDRLVKHLVLSR